MQKRRSNVLQWHPAFYAGLQIEFEQEADKLIFENEHQLGTKPKEIDVLIIKKDAGQQIDKNIGRIFRKYNIVEYKSPDDYLSIDDYYKTLGYACFYKSDTSKVNEIKVEDITITFVCKRHPRKLFRHLKKERQLSVVWQEAGICYISGELFPIQLIFISDVSKEKNFWLRCLTNDLKKQDEIQELIQLYEIHKNENLYNSVMNIVVNANYKVFEEVQYMCEALLELMKDELDACRSEGMQQGIQQGIQSLIEACKSLGATKDVILEMLSEKFMLSAEDAEGYMKLYW